MKLAVVIPTLGRRAVVNRLLAHLEKQTRAPDLVVISAPDSSHVEEYRSEVYEVRYIFGGRGLCQQRNRALAEIVDRFDVITYFDDDFVPAENYLSEVVNAFVRNEDFAVVMGDVLEDGARHAGFSFEDGMSILCEARAALRPEREPVDHPGAYGCNMSIRASLIGELRFDERLPLYGWQEDIDFTNQLRRQGRVVWLATLTGVHLGLKGGRVSGVKFGYSQIVNPVYLVLKGTMPLGFAAGLMARNLAANFVKSLRPEPYVDRRGRLKGNMLAIGHVALGRVEPEYILEL